MNNIIKEIMGCSGFRERVEKTVKENQNKDHSEKVKACFMAIDYYFHRDEKIVTDKIIIESINQTIGANR